VPRRDRHAHSQGFTQASINRVIVEFNALSVRRISSILMIEWSTVVWCLPPNPGDFLERSAGELPDDVHCDLTWQGVTTT
jgi:hypothetical protein